MQRFHFESAEAVLDVMGIDGQHGRDIGLGRGAHHDFGCFLKHHCKPCHQGLVERLADIAMIGPRFRSITPT